MEFKRALTYPLNDPDWLVKMLIAAAMNLVPLAGPLFLLGYYRELYLKLSREGDSRLPEWERFGDFIIDGLKLLAVSLVYMLPLLLFYLAFFLMMFALLMSSGSSEMVLLIIVFAIPFTLYFLYVMTIQPAMLVIYFETGSIASALKPNLHWRLIRGWGASYWLALIMTHVYYFLSIFGILLCLIGVYATMAWAGFAFIHLIAQCQRRRPVQSIL